MISIKEDTATVQTMVTTHKRKGPDFKDNLTTALQLSLKLTGPGRLN